MKGFRRPTSVAVALLVACGGGSAEPTTTETSPTTGASTTITAAVTTTPEHTTAEPVTDAKDRLVIHAVGDVNLCDCLHRAFRIEGFDIAFSAVRDVFARDALTIVNLECAQSELGSPMTAKPYSFRCDPAGIQTLVDGGVDVVSIANNHSADYGFEALSDARSRLEAAGLNPVGAGSDLAEANAPAFFERGGWTIAVVAFSGVAGRSYSYAQPKSIDLINPWFATSEAPGIAPATFDNMTAVVAALDPVVDLVIVSIHQGEYNETHTPGDLEISRGEALVEAGADVVIAHHHHRLLPLEYYRDRPIFWGMGNFVWERLDRDRNTTAVAEIVVEPDGSIAGRLIPAYIESSGHPVLLGMPDYSVRYDREPAR
jgi:poly-gamma-glutamate capsule biosynthesis protein CapA/YwtB (metallophosphatase superfamily)